ncbi:MAG: hypothetical protein GC160_03460 [Acidobacteria bacterium]|nr:hypothetical protein [Acidobacteriota bacterium]
MRLFFAMTLLFAQSLFAGISPTDIQTLALPAELNGLDIWLGHAIFDDAGNQYVVGQARVPESATPTRFPSSNSGDALALKYSPTGELVYFKTFGAASTESVGSSDWAVRAAVAPDGRLYIIGMTNSPDFPNAGDGRTREGFVATLSADGSQILGGRRIDGSPTEIALGPNGAVYVAGDTTSPTFPVTVGPIPVTGPGEIYVSADGGVTWQASSTGLIDRSFGRPIIHPTDPQTIYLEQARGLARSDDGGATWTESGVPTSSQASYGPPWFRPRAIALDPHDVDRVYNGGTDGLYRSDDGGASWTKLPLEPGFVSDLVLDPDSPDTLYALTPNGVFKSADAGQTWTLKTTAAGTRGALALDPSAPQTVYFAESRPGGQVQRSTDGGETWTSIRNGLPENLVVSSLAVDPRSSQTLYLASDYLGVFRSEDAGASWQARGADTYANSAGARIVVDPFTDGRLWVNGQRSDDEGLTWERVGADLEFPLTTSFALDPLTPNRLLASAVAGDREPNAFLLRLTADLETDYARAFGGIHKDSVGGLAVDDLGGAAIVGVTASRDFPLVNPLDAEIGDREDAFLIVLSPDGETVELATFLGDRSAQRADGVVYASDRSLYVAGRSEGPIVNGSSFESTDGFVAKIAADLGAVDAWLPVGGSNLDYLTDLAINSSGQPVILGATSSNDLPVTASGGDCGPLDLPNSALFVALLDADLAGVESLLRYAGPPHFVTAVLGLAAGSGSQVEIVVNGPTKLALPDGPLEQRQGLQRLTVEASPSSAIAVTCAVNGASFLSGTVAPGQILTLRGTGLGPDELVAFAYVEGEPLPTELGGVRVLFDGEPAPVIHAWDLQTSVVAPASVAGKSQVSVEVEVDGELSDPITLAVSAASPGVFVLGPNGESALSVDWLLVGAEHPVAGGDYVAVYITGAGQLSSAVDWASWAQLDAPYATVSGEVVATIGGAPAEVAYAGQAPGLVNAVQQVNLLVPAGTPAGEVDLTLEIAGRPAQTVKLFVGGAQ